MTQPTFTVSPRDEKQGYATLVIEPLEKGYGHTLGNALRRVMLSSLKGAAVTAVKIHGVNHQFTTLEGMSEDVVELILNIKQLRIKSVSGEAGTLRLSVKGEKEVTAADIEAPAGFEIINTDQHLATLGEKASLQVEITVESGFGYSMADERKSETIGLIPVDALFSPVVRVAYTVEATRVGRRTDFDKLVMQVWTDGTIEPKEALEEAARILVGQFQQVYNPVVSAKAEAGAVVSAKPNEVLKLTVEELDLPTRIANALRKGGFKTVEDLVTAKRDSIVKVKNLGEKSIGLIEEAVAKKGVSLQEA